MRNNFLALVAVFAMTIFCSSTTISTSDMQGTWKVVENNGKPVSPSFEHIKLITNNSFFWYRSDSEGNVYTGAGGFYTLKDDVYTENITSTLPGMSRFLGKKGVYEVKIEGNKMYVSGILNGTIKITEVWERVTNLSK